MYKTDHPDLNVSTFMGKSIGPNRINCMAVDTVSGMILT